LRRASRGKRGNREVKMGEIEELSREQAKWMVRVQELEKRRKELEPEVVPVDYGEETTKPWVYTPEKMAEIDKVDKELEEAKAKLREIEDKLRKHLKRKHSH
jgi:seryl-tRNA synthetase